MDDALAIHAALVAESGHLTGVRDLGLIESALARPRNSHAYGEEDLLVLAVQLGVAIARNHGFLDGNKRTGLTLIDTMLGLNGFRIEADDDLHLGIMLERVLTRHLDEDDLVDAIHPHVVPR